MYFAKMDPMLWTGIISAAVNSIVELHVYKLLPTNMSIICSQTSTSGQMSGEMFVQQVAMG